MLSKVLAIDPANKQTAYVLFDKNTWEIYDKDIIPNREFIEMIEKGNFDRVALEIIVNMGVSGRTLFETAEYVGIYTYITNTLQKPLKRVRRTDVKKHFKVKRSTKNKKQPSADSQIRSRLIERFGEVGTKSKPGYFYGFKADIWQAFAVGVYAVDEENNKKQGD